MDAARRGGINRPTAIIGVGLLAIAAITWMDARSMTITANYGVGADAASYFVALFLTILGLGHIVSAVRSGGGSDEAEQADWAAVAWIILALAGLILSIWFGGGFILGSALLFAFTARAFGRRQLLVDLLIGLAMAAFIFFMFNNLLKLSLPKGPLETLLF